MKYDHKAIDKKWQDKWDKDEVYKASDTGKKPKKYVLIEFPYPSGEGLHMGHLRPYTAGDTYSRYWRMKGFETMYPMGWDAFGLPAENYAIKNKLHPRVSTAKNIENAKRQLKSWGMGFDWSREVNTTDPGYYKWTQWIFLQFFKAGLAYEATGLINWCPKDKTGLANEEVVDGKCERCGTMVEKKEMRQWYLKITAYAEKLLEGLKTLDWPMPVKLQQENWIGKKIGINIEYTIDGGQNKIVCFTTRPDTNFGATFIVIGPEHPLLKSREILNIDKNYWEDIEKYKQRAAASADIERTAEGRKKTGVATGLFCINNLNGAKMPLFVADYVLGHVGTGAVVGVPGHDKRDFEFAQIFKLPVIRVVQKDKNDTGPITSLEQVQEDEGFMVNSEFLNGLNIHEATEKIMDYMEEKGYGKRVVNYKLRDWVFSRQRYWGEPIPLIHCENCAKVNFVILHGWQEKISTRFYPWLKEQLEAKGAEVTIPKLPRTDGPKEQEQVSYVLENCRIDENTILVGHSLGSAVAMKVLEKLPIKVAGFISVGGFANPNFKDHSRPFEKDFSWNFDFKKIKNNTGFITVLHDSNDDAISDAQAQELSEAFDVPVTIKTGKSAHFRSEQEPEVLSVCLQALDQSHASGWIPVPEKDLPVKLPEVKDYEPTGTGESPLAVIDKWVNVKCPRCGGKAKRETNTMPQWAGSSWYWLRYSDPHNDKEFASKKLLKRWQPVDVYFGGMEHTTLHLLYSRFWNLFLHDQGLVTEKEPYLRRVPHGIVLASDGEKMSKSRGNVVNPDEIVEKFGADVMRMYEMFLGPHDATVSWNDKGIMGVVRFLDRVSKFVPNDVENSPGIHKLVKKISSDIESFKFNTAIAAFMEFLNMHENLSKDDWAIFLRLLAPFAPHLTEELWEKLGYKKSIHLEKWPSFDEKLIQDENVTIVVQVLGKVRGTLEMPVGISQEEIKQKALSDENIKKHLAGKEIVKEIFVPDKLINFVVK